MALDPITTALRCRRIQAIVIGGSAGSVNALIQILPKLPRGFLLPIVIVVHVPQNRDSSLPNLFLPRIQLPVLEAQDKESLANGTVYFAAPGYHLSIEREHCFSLSCEDPVEFARPAIDVLMMSAADAYGTGLLGILLTGANRDGARGMAAIAACGGMTVVQDPQQAQAATMPEEAISLRTPDLILALEDITRLLIMLADGQ